MRDVDDTTLHQVEVDVVEPHGPLVRSADTAECKGIAVRLSYLHIFETCGHSPDLFVSALPVNTTITLGRKYPRPFVSPPPFLVTRIRCHRCHFGKAGLTTFPRQEAHSSIRLRERRSCGGSRFR